MIGSIARYAPAIVGGSALAGFGLSFGRDVYKKAKKNWPIILVLVCLAGVYFAGMWLLRNYRTPMGSILKKCGALIVLAVSCIGVYLGAAVLAAMFAPAILATQQDSGNLSVDGASDAAGLLSNSPLQWILVLQGALFLIGAFVGIWHRRKRRLAWEAEEYNERFLSEHDLEVVDADEKGNLRLRDHADNIGYRLVEDLELAGELEFMALGKRNKRGYLEYDDTGKYIRWSGLADVR